MSARSVASSACSTACKPEHVPAKLRAMFPEGVPANVVSIQKVAAARGLTAAGACISFHGFVPLRVEFLGKVYYPRTCDTTALAAYAASALPQLRVRSADGTMVNITLDTKLQHKAAVSFDHQGFYAFCAAILTLLSPKRSAISSKDVQRILECSHAMAAPLKSLSSAFEEAYMQALAQGVPHEQLYEQAVAQHAAHIEARAHTLVAAIAAKEAAEQGFHAALAERKAQLTALAPERSLPPLEVPCMKGTKGLAHLLKPGATLCIELQRTA